MRAVPLDGRHRAGVADGLRSRAAARVTVGVEPQPVQKIEGDHIYALDRPGDEVLTRLFAAAREELERKVEGGRPGVCRIRCGETKTEAMGDLFHLVGPREFPPEKIQIERREDRGDGAAEQREYEKDDRHGSHCVGAKAAARAPGDKDDETVMKTR